MAHDRMIPIDAPPNHSLDVPEQDRKHLAILITALFHKWQLNAEEQLLLLGMSPEAQHALIECQQGQCPLPTSWDMLDRAVYLLEIHKGLRLLFPENPEMRYAWIKNSNLALGGTTPFDVMVKDGLVGVVRVCRFIDFQLQQ